MHLIALQFRRLALVLLFLLAIGGSAFAQEGTTNPISNDEFVQRLYQLPKHPGMMVQLVDDIRHRGIGFPLTDGLKSLVATKSGNDPVLRRTLEEASRRRENPVSAKLPPEAEAVDLLARTKVATLGAVETMPDFVVRQEISRSNAYARTNNWMSSDRLTVAVSYRATSGEDYKLLAINGLPAAATTNGKDNYLDAAGGTISTGEYVTMLAEIFNDSSRTDFKAVDTDTLRGRPTIVYEYTVKRVNSHQQLTAKGVVNESTIAGYTGKMWVDRETNRVLRLDETATEIPSGFPIIGANSLIDYDWVTIAGKKHLLPSRAEIRLTIVSRDHQQFDSRNVIRFRDYQKYGTEVKIIEDVDDDEPVKKP